MNINFIKDTDESEMDIMEYCEDINVNFQFGDIDLKSFILEFTEEYCSNKIKKIQESQHLDGLQSDEKDL